jgi:hypothetical protein
MLTLASPYTGYLPNPARLVFPPGTDGQPNPADDEDAEVWKVRMELRSSAATNVFYGAVMIVIRNGVCTLVSRVLVSPLNLNADDIDRYITVGTRTVATGYTDLKSAIYAAANNANARRTAWETHLRTAGHIDSSLA